MPAGAGKVNRKLSKCPRRCILSGMAEGRRVALVTGGAKRVGRAIVLALAEARFDVAFTYLSSEDDAKAISREIAGHLGKPLAIKADLTDPEPAVATIGEAFARQFDRLDLL